MCHGDAPEARGRTFTWISVPAAGDVSKVLLKRVRYGQAPQGFVNKMVPHALATGCYEVDIGTASGRSGGVMFEVKSDGSVQQR